MFSGVILNMDKKVKFKTASNKEYTLLWKNPPYDDADGLCWSPESKKPKIMIRPNLLPRRKLSVTIEEVVHAFWFDKSETEVRKFSGTLSKILYQYGWRLNK